MGPACWAGDAATTILRTTATPRSATGLIDLAVNVRRQPLPAWLAGPIAASLTELAAYPDATAATAAVAARHGRDPAEVLLTAGAAQAFVLLAQALRGARRPVVVHPQFTEPEAALRNAGHAGRPGPAARGRRLPARPGAWSRTTPTWSSSATPPTRPRCCTRPRTIAALARPGRVLVVDEAFADTTYAPGVPGEPESLAGRRDLPGLVVLRSLTKTWGLAGLRIGYLLAPADLVAPAGRGAAALGGLDTRAGRGRRPARRRARWPPSGGSRAELAARAASTWWPACGTCRASRSPGDPASAFVALRLAGADQVRLELRRRG